MRADRRSPVAIHMSEHDLQKERERAKGFDDTFGTTPRVCNMSPTTGNAIAAISLMRGVRPG